MTTMNDTDQTKKTGHLTIDEIRNECKELTGDDKDEAMLCMIEEEFRNGINSVRNFNRSVTFYGSSRLKEDNPVYKKIQNLAYRISKELDYTIITGGGGGAMEAANRGAFEAGGQSLGLTIKLPHEQKTNPYVKEEIPFQYFFARQASMSYATEVCIFCTGGFGTLDELFEILTYLQTGKIDSIPIILYGSEFWDPLQNIIHSVLLDKFQTIGDKDINLYTITDDDDKILEIIKNSKIRNGENSLK